MYSGEPVTDSLIVNDYPRLYEQVNSRNANGLSDFLNHESEQIRNQAWRALASTPIDSIGPYIQMALKGDTKLPWFTISMHELSTEQLRALEVHWLENPEKRRGISLVLGRQGDETTLDFLLDELQNAAGSDYEYDFALAVGRLMVDFRADNDEQARIIERAFLSEEERLIRAYLYGYYRGEVQDLSPKNRDLLYSSWKEYGLGNSDKVDQYMIRLLGGDVFYEITLYQNSEEVLDLNIQLAVELSQAVSELELNDRNILAIRILLMHENPHVAREALKSLEGKLSRGGNLYRFITSEIVSDTLSEPYVWLQALQSTALVDTGLVEKNSNRLEHIPEENPYLLTQALNIRQLSESPAEFINRIESFVEGENTLKALYAINALSTFWNGLDADAKNSGLAGNVREIVFKGLDLQDRGVAFACGGLLADETLFDDSHFAQINRALNTFSLPEDIEVYQTFGGFYKQRFEEQAKPVVDSLASLGYAPLNRALRNSGWDVPVPEASGTGFRTPGWERLWEIGKQPVWVLETDEGIIRVRMNTLVAPATISAIDSLTMAGAYNGVPFHRVVPNFVIQGGDIESQDGFGGPDFILPTEASELEYRKGAAGIASAGTDTEGSQYFFMHQWKPHLNGRYTLFGNVIEGMDVIDRIIPGDTVRQVYWE
jgi:cyclophilin family peptidyl-prolyl cis-trans isomerase